MNPVAFNIFGKDIYWYGIIIALCVALGIWIAIREAERKKISVDAMIDLMLWCVPLAIIGARIYYVVFAWDSYKDNILSVFFIWNGGVAIYGAIIGGLLGLFIYAKRSKIDFMTLADIIMPSLVLGQAVGRWGNFFNQEAYGPLVTNPSWQWFPASVYISSLQEFHMATFFYESIWCLGIFAFLMLYRKKSPPKGNIFMWYILLYGLERSIVEGLRMDSLYAGGVRISQILSILMVVGAAIFLIVMHRKRILAIPVNDDNLRLMTHDRDEDEASNDVVASMPNRTDEENAPVIDTPEDTSDEIPDDYKIVTGSQDETEAKQASDDEEDKDN